MPAVIAVGAAIAALTGAWFEAALTEARRTRALSEKLIAFHAADAALLACVTQLQARTARHVDTTSRSEPTAWRRASAFDGPDAIEPFTAWPMSAQPPRCLIEAWNLVSPIPGQAYLVTARGTGPHASTSVRLQMQVLMRDGRIVMRRWRRVAASN